MEEEDEVIQEIDVKLANIDPLLLMFQYPLRTMDRPYGDEGKLNKVTVKSLNNKISMTYGLNKDVPNYDENASNHRILNHKLSSTHIPTQTSYCVGSFKDNTLYLSPIDSIYQMRPDFEHVNKESMERMVGGAELEAQKQKKAKELLRMQIVDDGKREQHKKDIELEMEEEQVLQIFDKDSNQAKMVLNNMTNAPDSQEDESNVLINIYSDTYLSQILPANQNDDYQAEITKQREGKITMDNLLKLPYREFLATLFIQ